MLNFRLYDQSDGVCLKYILIASSSSSFRKCDGGLGTACFVTGTYGMIAASQTVKMIVNDDYPRPRLIKSSVKYWNEKHEERMKNNKDQGVNGDGVNDILESFISE